MKSGNRWICLEMDGGGVEMWWMRVDVGGNGWTLKSIKTRDQYYSGLDSSCLFYFWESRLLVTL